MLQVFIFLVLVTTIHSQGDMSNSSTLYFCSGVTQTLIKGTLIPSLFHKVSNSVLIIASSLNNYITLYRSTDGGITWTDLTPLLPNVNYTQNIIPLPYIGITGAFWSEADPQIGYVPTFGGLLYVTQDGGATFTSLTPRVLYQNVPYIGNTVQGIYAFGIKPHPIVPSWVVAEHYSPYCMTNIALQDGLFEFYCPLGPNDVIDGLSLSYSLDFGVTWTNIWATTYTENTDFTWANAGQNGVSNQTGYASSSTMGGTMISYFNTTNWFTEGTTVTPPYLFVIDTLWDDALETALIAGDLGSEFDLFSYTVLSQNLAEAEFPLTANSTGAIAAMYILDVSNGSTFVSIARYGDPANSMGLFVSDVIGTDFSLSYGALYWDQVDDPAFTTLERLTGIYFINGLSGTDIVTLATYNIGGSWGTLAAPANICNDCTLQLWGPLALQSNIEVKTAGYGIVVGNGNIGPSVVNNASTGALFLSRDAGRTWAQIWNSSVVFDISDFGELIAVGVWDTPSNQISYSFDEGITWTECAYNDAVSEGNMTITNVYVDLVENSPEYSMPSPYVTSYNPSLSFIWVLAVSQDTQQSFLFSVNVSRSLPPCSPSDYELFTPQGTGSNGCILGRLTTYTRRKQTSQCVTDPAVLANVTVQNCACTRADYLCVYCFIEAPNSTCVLDTSDPLCQYDPYLPPGCVPYEYYSLPSAYRKVSGSTCIGSVTQLTENRTGQCPPPLAPEPAPGYWYGPNPFSYDDISDSPDTTAIALGITFGILIALLIGLVVYRLVRNRFQGAKFDEFAIESPRGDSIGADL